MATIPQYSPTLPFLGLIPGGLSPGRMLRIKGIITNHGERCQIYIQSGAAVNPRDDVMLHISIRPNEHAIVRNTIQNQVVGPEERYGGCPIQYGVPFDLLVLAETLQYKIAINGVHFCTFAHRLPLHRAQFISISAGGGTIYSILTEADVPGSVPANPYPPIVHPPAAPYAPPMGFVPNPPPSNLPPPPPYTPLPTHPIGGGSGHYPGAGGYPPPPPPPMMPGYPHYPSPPSGAPLPAAVPFSPPITHHTSGEENRVKMKNPLKQSIASGIQQTQDFLRNAVGEKSSAQGMASPHSNVPPSHTSHAPHPSTVQPGFVTMPASTIAPGYPGSSTPVYPTAPPPNVAGYPGPGHPQPQQQRVGFTVPGDLVPTALATGATAAIASKVLPKGKTKKLLKCGAAAGAVGLGGYALSHAFRRKGSSSSSSSSDSD